jgi:hypothetical protein
MLHLNHKRQNHAQSAVQANYHTRDEAHNPQAHGNQKVESEETLFMVAKPLGSKSRTLEQELWNSNY